MARRLSWDEPSLTLTCAPAQNQTGRCHPVETRPLTVREYARIQTFPDDWVFCGSLMSQYKQIGNAVPVNLAAALGRSIIALLNVIETDAATAAERVRLSVATPRSPRPRRVAASSVKPEQLLLFDAPGLYLVGSTPVTLLGTYRKRCRDWIVAHNLYNYPVTYSDLDTIPELTSVRRLVLQRRNDAPLFFTVQGYSLEKKAGMAKLGYPVNRRHSAKTQYILYQLQPLAVPTPSAMHPIRCIIGKGVQEG